MPITRETTFAARDLTEPVEVAHTKDGEHDLFLLRIGGRGIDYEMSRREAAALRQCLDEALAEGERRYEPEDASCSRDDG